MKRRNCLALAALGLLVPLTAFGDSTTAVTFTNNDGSITSNAAQTTLSLQNSTLYIVQGLSPFGSGYDCTANCSSGSYINFTTGAIQSTTTPTGPLSSATLFPTSGEVTYFGAGGGFSVTEKAGVGLSGFSFSGSFSSEEWLCATLCTANYNAAKTKILSYTGSWTFVAHIVNATLTIDGQTVNIANAGTVDLTTTSATVTYHAPGSGTVTFTDNQGTTNFNAASPVPEPGSLALFGTGLIAVGLVTRRMTAGKAASGSL